jgi:hypothetical protein
MADWVDSYYEPIIIVKPPVGVLNTAAIEKLRLPAVEELRVPSHFVSGKAKGSIPIKTIRFYPEPDDG